MEHLDAKRLQAAEKYVLGELAPELRDEFEEHYFDCADCTEDVKAASAFIGASQEIFREEAGRGAPQEKKAAGFSGWFAWLRPAVAIPAMAALVALIVYQNVAGVPRGRNRAGGHEAQAFGTSFHVQGATRGGSDISRITVGPNEAFALDFDFTPSQMYGQYRGELVDAAGKTVLTVRLPGELSNKEVHVTVPGGVVRPGEYSWRFVGKNDMDGPQASGEEVQRVRFAVEFRR